MADLALYLGAMDTTIELVTHLSPADLERTCIACPAWSIRDVVAHHVHVAHDFVNGDFPASAITALVADRDAVRLQAGHERDEWTQAGVDARRSITLPAVLDEWRGVTARMDDESARVILDLTMHLYDIKETLGDTADRDSPLVDDALTSYYRRFLTPRLAHSSLAVNVDPSDTAASLVTDPEAPTVSGSAYELLRSIGGRRTRNHADATLDWGDTDERIRERFSVYNWPT